MQQRSLMTTEEALALLDNLLQGQKLKDTQELVFRYSWQGWTYPQIAEYAGYDTSHIRDVGSQLWQQPTQATGERVNKNNVQAVLRRQAFQRQSVADRLASPVNSNPDSSTNKTEGLIALSNAAGRSL